MARRLELPEPPADLRGPVRAWEAPVRIMTYDPLLPDRYPMFLEKRVYQGSSGRVYPLPCYGRISERKSPRNWRALHIENEFLRVMVLPELGGRVHVILDKTTGEDLVYRQDVIKPALVGLAGPWASGGIEFNWPQHHRPATYMATAASIESHPDGSRTIWCADHDPLNRMSGAHGIRLYPGRAVVELRARLYNRTPHTQTFLWWANVATRVHEHYQSFFPPDVHCVADHAKRATARYPLCDGRYYGVDYGRRAREGVPAEEAPPKFVPPPGAYAPNDLSWYANIPVPTSYMCMGSKQDFFGGYDHRAGVGILHVANRHISPGKKQWTWGNHPFGYAWDRNLTDPDEAGVCHPYIELMAGVYTDNQPDFSFLAPGETKSFSQFWAPIHRIGPATHANVDVAAALRVEGPEIRVGVSVTREFPGATVELLSARNSPPTVWTADLVPGRPFLGSAPAPRGAASALRLIVRDREGRELLSHSPAPRAEEPLPPAATEPPAPALIASCDELYVTGMHLEQYRHATRTPEAYWREALRRDPLDSRCNTAMGRWHLRRGEFGEAERHLRAAVSRQTLRNPNPPDGEACYALGLTLRHAGRIDDAYDALYKSTWNAQWAAPAFHALAEIDLLRGDVAAALDHSRRALRLNADDLRLRCLHAVALRKAGDAEAAEAVLRESLTLQPLDPWTLLLLGEPVPADAATWIDVALDCAAIGLWSTALDALSRARPGPTDGTAPMLHYHAARIHERAGDRRAARAALRKARRADPTYCFPNRLEDLEALRFAIDTDPRDPRAPFYLGNLLYDRRRHEEAVAAWERAARLEPDNPVVWRNLGVAYFNVRRDARRAKAAFAKAAAAAPDDARLLYEQDQLAKRLGEAPARRLRSLERRQSHAGMRDDLTLELCDLYNTTGRPAKAQALLSSRRFQPWEGGEGLALQQHVRSHLLLGRAALAKGNAAAARRLFEAALEAPENLGEARHLLANQSDVHYYLGIACNAAGDTAAARRHWGIAADFAGDFQQMSVQPYSEMTYFSAMAARELGRPARHRELLEGLGRFARELHDRPAVIDYFATSLPTMLLFEDDLPRRQKSHATLLLGLSLLGLGRASEGRSKLRQVLRTDPANALANDLLQRTPS